MTTRKIVLLSIIFAFAMALLSLCDGYAQSHGAFIACAILWGLGLIALAILDKK